MKISLITACYNSAKTIKTAMDSVLAQKGVDIEYIVVDGGSTDGTVAIVGDFLTQRRRGAEYAEIFGVDLSRVEVEMWRRSRAERVDRVEARSRKQTNHIQ